MDRIALLKNPIQEYAWGSLTAIPELLGQPPPSARPQAELWMGAHPLAPSLIETAEGWRPLGDVIDQDPVAFLGKAAAARFHNELPFLFKVLAAARPLSLQAHPDQHHAVQGFARENSLGIPPDDPARNYRDRNHKPELLCALSPFWAVKGFRPADEILALTETLSLPWLEADLAALRADPTAAGLQRFFQALVSLPRRNVESCVAEAAASSVKHADNAVFHWIGRLAGEYPGDIGVICPLFLNLVRLRPGEALFLAPGEIHAYFEGVGIELMANSDNVVRGGLTSKHVDVPELMRTVSFTAEPLAILRPTRTAGGEAVYSSGAKEFELSTITLAPGMVYRRGENHSVEIILCTSGSAEIHSRRGSGHTLKKGTSVIIPAAVQQYTLRGDGVFYKAGVPGQCV